MSRYATGFAIGLLVLLALSTGCSRHEAAPAVAETADQAVLLVTQGLADGRPQVVWHALPESYQQDVTGLIHDFAGKMDVELWNRSFGVVQKLTLVLGEKREFILDHPMVASKIEDREEADEAWDAVIDILDVVANSDLADLDRVKELDVERFLSGTGAELADRFEKIEAFAPAQATKGSFFGLADARATLISSEGDHARVSLQIPGEPAKEEDYVRVEGKWIPAQMANEWDKTMAEAREQLADFSGEEMQQNKQVALMQLSMIEGVLDQLLATKTEEEFQTAIAGVMGMAMGAMMARAQSSSEAPAFDPSVTTITTLQDPSSTSLPILNAAPQPQVVTQKKAPNRGSVESYIGKPVSVTERGGRTTSGVLVELTDKILFLEKRIGSSSMTVEMNRARITKVEPL